MKCQISLIIPFLSDNEKVSCLRFRRGSFAFFSTKIKTLFVLKDFELAKGHANKVLPEESGSFSGVFAGKVA